jgi:DNA-binding NarL/FixJ family response regulator
MIDHCRIVAEADSRIDEALNAGANGFFRKDLSIRTLEIAILETLNGKKSVYA